MSEKFESEKKRLQQEIDELKVQLALGKADAVEYIEERKTEFSEFVDETKKQLKDSGKPVADQLSTAEGVLDELKLQLALGRMESADACRAQQEKIGAAIDHARKQLRDTVDSDLHAVHEGFDHQAESFKTKLEAAALNIGAGTMLAADETKELFHSISEKLHHAKAMTSEEISEARRYIRERIQKHRG
ncbi:MAG: hypothetical protein P1U87_02770 [Verrucomicrobiales bacterium]|nr:hypothetical protein [Verrucomicrobiales bacterium]